MKRFLPLLFLTLLIGKLHSQCMLYPVSITERANNSTAIVEGEVMSQQSFWNTAKNNIYTLNRIRPVKIFNWNVAAPYTQDFFIVTEGGVVGSTMQNVSATLELKVGDVGVFFAVPTKTAVNDGGLYTNYLKFDAYSGPQGLIKFDDNQLFAHDPFANYLIAPDLYKQLTAILAKDYIEVGGYDVPAATTAVAPTIISFTPDSLSAGTKSVVTITGLNFGTTRGAGKVSFKDGNNGGSSTFEPEDVQYISWTDTEIKVEVPTRAGSGKIAVDNGSGTAQSANNLVITFSQLNVTDGNNDVFQTKHIGKNGTGYTWQFYTGFDANTAAKQSFLRAFQNWRCGTLINWDIGANTTIDTIALDGVNVVRFDVGSELPNGVLGRCSSWWNGCFVGGTTLWFVNELDIVFNDNTNWNFDTKNPTNSQYDFESVAVHELGHGHQLGHVIKSTEIMHYSIANGQKKRVLSAEGDLSGGNYVMDLNLQGGVCGRNTMVALNPNFCSLIPVAGFTNSANTICPWETVTFTDTSGGSTNSFAWDFGDNASPAQATGKGPHTVTYTASGKKTVQLIVGGIIGNDTSTKVELVVVQPERPVMPIAVFGADTACVGAQQYQINAVPNATQYTWGINGGTITNSTDTFTVATFTSSLSTADIWVRASNSCGSSDSSLKTIPVFDKPTADFTFAIQGDTILLSNTSQNAYAHLWKFTTGQTSAVQNINFIPALSGTYTVKILATNVCGTDSTVKAITFTRVSVKETLYKIGLKIYPNPFTNEATIAIDEVAKYPNIVFEVYDIAGKKLRSLPITATETTLSKQNLASGVYVYKVNTNGELLATGRIVIQ